MSCGEVVLVLLQVGLVMVRRHTKEGLDEEGVGGKEKREEKAWTPH